LYDVGIYSQAGALIANIGPTHFGATGLVATATLQGAKTINPGLYVFGWTGNAATLGIQTDHTTGTWAEITNIATSSAGTLPPSIGAVAIAPGNHRPWMALY
jgi:NADPH:quinone reductase-like Zn-dependent oxidoreductase